MPTDSAPTMSADIFYEGIPPEHRDLYATYVEEQCSNRDWVIPCGLNLLQVSTVVGQLQLALRHPSTTPAQRQIVNDVIAHFVKYLRKRGLAATIQVIELGFDETNDVPVEEVV